MKRVALILAILIGLAACKHTVRDSGCITRYTGPAYSYLPLKAGQLDTIQSLFSANGLSTANLIFTYYYSDTLKDSTNTPYLNQSVGATGIVNGLPVFSNSYAWNFRNGVWAQSIANPVYAYPGPDTTVHQTLPALRSAFFKAYESTVYGNGPNLRSPQVGRPGVYFHDSCLFAQLGYIDASAPPGNNGAIDYGKKLLKVWRVYLANSTPSPFMSRTPITSIFVADSTGQAWAQYLLIPGQLYFTTGTAP